MVRRKGVLACALVLASVLAQEANAQRCYWVLTGREVRIQRGDVETGTIEDLVATTHREPRAIALDQAGGRFFWVDRRLQILIRTLQLDTAEIRDVFVDEDPAYNSFTSIALDIENDKMYWADAGAGTINRANTDGTGAETIVSTERSFHQMLRLDDDAHKMYWTDADSNSIQRANLDGTDFEVLIDSGLSEPWGIALDSRNDKMYWTEFTVRRIQRADLDGTNVEMLIHTSNDPRGIALDVANGKMYWAECGLGARIMRANLDGTMVEQLLLIGPVSIVYDLALDLEGGRLYWVDDVRIMSAGLDGQNVEPIIAVPETGPRGLVLDPETNRMYWADTMARMIRRSNLDGSEIEDLAAADFRANGIVFDQETQCVYWTEWLPFSTAGTLRRLSLKTGAVEVLLITDPWSSGPMTFDPVGRRLYWVLGGYYIYTTDMDAQDGFSLLFTGGECRGLTVDAFARKLYWTSNYADYEGDVYDFRIYRSNLDASDIETVTSWGGDKQGVTLDTTLQKVYWNSQVAESVWRANFDGSEIERVFRFDGTAWSGIQLDLRVPGDCTEDRVFDLSDIVPFTACLDGPAVRFAPGCSCADENGNGRVDLHDFAAVERTLAAP